MVFFVFCVSLTAAIRSITLAAHVRSVIRLRSSRSLVRLRGSTGSVKRALGSFWGGNLWSLVGSSELRLRRWPELGGIRSLIGLSLSRGSCRLGWLSVAEAWSHVANLWHLGSLKVRVALWNTATRSNELLSVTLSSLHLWS